MIDSNIKKWLIITTDNLPEAYYMARHLLNNSQHVSMLNIKGRTFLQSFSVLKRLLKKRGPAYLADFFLGRYMKKYYQNPAIKPFADIDDKFKESIRSKIEYHSCEDPHSTSSLALVESYAPDYILFLGAPVIKPSLFSLAKQGTINWHHGFSPIYKGSDCVHWAMANKDFHNIGFTIHFVSEIVDGGSIILQRKVQVNKDLDFAEAIAEILLKGMEGFTEVVDNIISHKEINSKIQEKGGKHYPPAGWRTIRQACNNFSIFRKS